MSEMTGLTCYENYEAGLIEFRGQVDGYDIEAFPDDDDCGWEVWIMGVGVTQCEHLSQIEETVRDYLKAIEGLR